MASKVPVTSRIALRALARRGIRPRRPPDRPARILVAHNLLLGDTILLTPMLAKLRARFPDAQIVTTAPRALVPLYQSRPYGVQAWPFDPRDYGTVRAMPDRGGFDLALVPGDNRTSWLAQALGARWIVAHAGDRPLFKNLPIDEFRSYPAVPTAAGEIFAALVDGPAPAAYDRADWPAPAARAFDLPAAPYAVLHVGASGPLKRWEPEKWRLLAAALERRGMTVVWSGGRNEAGIVRDIDPDGRFASYAEQLDLPQLWHLLAQAALLVSPDTGVAHLARLTGVPGITLFGPGSKTLFGAGDFWRGYPRAEITIEDFPCRDQREQFRRNVPWVRRCGRTPPACVQARCMQAIDAGRVIAAAEALLAAGRNGAIAP